ncbi:MAG: sulfotransferase [Alphaproteobacteria bacterium]|nr:sulfotransferase [Alphaproteobacteria bacterium]MDE2163042.1 sulfotransferase [Alphaproteobacteria bacterium]MDE2265557.1 sulfotransferase [Alphaproteobacteria bacterium]
MPENTKDGVSQDSSAVQQYEAALSLHRQGKVADAERHYRIALHASPRHPGALHGLGVACVQNRRIEEAATFFRLAVSAAPQDPAFRNDLGLTLAWLGRNDDAVIEFEAALSLKSDFDDALKNLGNAYLALSRHEEATRQFERALALHPDNAAALMGYGDALSILGRPTEAHAAFEKLLAIDANYSAAHFGVGSVMKQLGRFDDARRAFERAISLLPNCATYHRALADIERFTDDDPRLAALERLARDENSLQDDQKVELNFALAKAYDDLRRYDSAFERLQRGNTIKRQSIAYDEPLIMETFREIAAAFAPALMQAKRGAGYSSEVPVFIVGMPRSGTTLVEQILASHPNVFGAGELPYLQDLIMRGHAGPEYPSDMTSFPDDALYQFGSLYSARIESLAPQAKRIIDKLPANFRHIGLIHLALPNARFIHLRRDPVDTCFSCYSKLFLNGLNYTYDLGELGRYYRAYEALMAHWHAVLPQGVILDVQYETLIENFEEEARRVVKFCDLEWDEHCLAFHETKRAVRTLSEVQVRQPLFKNSIGRSQPYKKWLTPLYDALR